jgi:pimeloyl-ACP methyl ester carboxylesterase
MAYMDVPPDATPNGRTVVLLHGMNFGGFYFGRPIEVLRKEGFRVVVPDQIGFGRSSKPVIPYSFHDMAQNTRKLLESLGIARAAVVGHSMGGMTCAGAGRGALPMRLTKPRWRNPTISSIKAFT